MDAARIRFRTGYVGAGKAFRIYQTPGDWTNAIITVDPTKVGPKDVRAIVKEAFADLEPVVTEIIVKRANSGS